MLERIHKLIKHDIVPPKSVIDLLTDTLIGTAGTRYQLLDTVTKIHTLHKPHFLYLERNGKAVGSVTICERTIALNEKQENGYYMRYFAFNKLFQGGTNKGHGGSNFHTYLKALLQTSNLDPVSPQQERSLYWAYIDPENLRSYNMHAHLGLQTIGTFKTKAFSRANPKTKNIERLTKQDEPVILKQIQNFYKGFQFFSPIHLFEQRQYFVLKVDGEIVCGIQANPVHWRIKSLPGTRGKILLKTARYIPGIRKLINPKNHLFLATEGLFWEKGYEKEVEKLLEGVLAETNHNSLLIWTDEYNGMLNQLPLNWGFIQRMKKDNKICIVAKSNGYSEDEISKLKAAPKYLSGFDVT